MSNKYSGKLSEYFETGLEGLVWVLVSNDGETIPIKEGDTLIVYGRDKQIIFNDVIICDKETGAVPRPTNRSFIQQQALGYWVKWIQKGWMPDDWARLFLENFVAELKVE